MNWQAVPQACGVLLRDTPQSVHRPRGGAGASGGTVMAAVGGVNVMDPRWIALVPRWRKAAAVAMAYAMAPKADDGRAGIGTAVMRRGVAGGQTPPWALSLAGNIQ